MESYYFYRERRDFLYFLLRFQSGVVGVITPYQVGLYEQVCSVIDRYMNLTFQPSLSFDDVCYKLSHFQLGWSSVILSYIEKYGDLRLKSYYMSLAPARFKDGDLL